MEAVMAMQRLWSRRTREGARVDANLFADLSIAESTCEISVRGARSDDLARRLADVVRCSIEGNGAIPVREKL
jgi:hypothetical protein